MVTAKYEYTYLRHGVYNARIPVKTTETGISVVVSLSYSGYNSPFMSVGTEENLQGAILVCGLELEDLYTLPQEEGSSNITNVKDCETDQDVEQLVKLASGINPTHCICVWDATSNNPEESWLPRFLIEEGTLDADEKLQYVLQVYAKPHFKEQRFALTSDIEGVRDGSFFNSLPAPQL